MDYFERLAPGGLVFLGLVRLEDPFIPPVLAMMAQGYQSVSRRRSRSVVGREVPDFVARANEGWFGLSRGGGLFGDDREFLVGVGIRADVGDWWWARVRPAESWDVMGAGAAAALGTGFGVPEFVMLSLSGEVIVCGMPDESSVGTVLVEGFRELDGLREIAAWKADWPRTPPQERAAARRWLDSGR